MLYFAGAYVPESALERLECRRPAAPQYLVRSSPGGTLAGRWNLIVPPELSRMGEPDEPWTCLRPTYRRHPAGDQLTPPYLRGAIYPMTTTIKRERRQATQSHTPMVTLDQHIEITPGVAGGKPRIAGHRITVQDVAIWHERLGRSADEIAAEHGLTLADVHAALAYYFDHRAEVDRSMADGAAFAASLKERTPSRVREKLRKQKPAP